MTAHYYGPTVKNMSSQDTHESLTIIENDPSFKDVYAEIVGLTEYHVNGVDYVNFSFLGHKVASLVDEQGRPASARIELKKVGSVTMTLDRAIALREAMIGGLNGPTTDSTQE